MKQIMIALFAAILASGAAQAADGWKVNANGQQYRNIYAKNGTLKAETKDPDGSIRRDTGRWWKTADGNYCMKYDHWQNGRTICRN